MKIFRLLFIIIINCLLTFEADSQIVSVSIGTNMNIEAGTIFSADNMVLIPSAKFTLTGISLVRNSSIINTSTSLSAIARVYKFSKTSNPFSGIVQINYQVGTELKSIVESNLKMYIQNGTIWNVYTGGNQNLIDHYISSLPVSAVTLNEITLGVCTPPVTPSIILTQANCILGTGTISVSSTKTALTFSNDGINYNNTTGVFAGLNPGSYYITAKNATGCISAAVNGILNVAPSMPFFTTQPSAISQSVCLSSLATALNVVVSGTGLTYKWYRNTISSNVSGTLISGATAANYLPVTTTAGTLYYYCVASNGTCNATSSVSGAIISVALPAKPATIGGTLSVCTGATTQLSEVTLNGVWSSSNNAIASISSKGLVTGISVGTVSVVYTITNATGCMSSNTVTITVKGSPIITQQPASLTTAATQPASFTIAGTGTVSSYKWELCTNGTTWSTIAKAGIYTSTTTDKLTISSVSTGMNGYKYRCTETGNCTAQVSDAAILSVNSPIIVALFSITKDVESTIPVTLFELKAYPNPSRNTFHLIVKSGVDAPIDIVISNILGIPITRMKTMPGQDLIFGSNLLSGKYILQVLQGNQQKSIKLIKE